MKILPVCEELSFHPEGTFLSVAEFNNHSFGACSITGTSPVWEMHPDTDEYFHILEGTFVILLREDDGIKEYNAPAGSVFVVPKGIWHKPAAPGGSKFMYFTPGQSLHSELEDPGDENAL